MLRFAVITIWAMFTTAPALHAAVVKPLVRSNSVSVNILKPDLFRPYELGFALDAGVFVCDNGVIAAARGVCQTITLNQKVPQPIVASASSKAENVSGGKDPDYSLYLDLIYMDGSQLWGQSASFDTGTHDWQTRQVRVVPEKPVKQVIFYLLLRGHSGKAYFKDARLSQMDLPLGAAAFDGLAVAVGSGATGFAVRDVAANSDFTSLSNSQSIGLKLETHSTPHGSATFHQARLTNTTGKDRAITLIYTLALPGNGWQWLAGPRTTEPTQSPRDYHALSAGRFSRDPLAAVGRDGKGHAIILDMAYPAVFRVGFSAATNELYIAYDLALTPEKPSADFRFAVASFDSTWGFRGAVAAMYESFPEHFRCRTPRQGVWMPFHKISKVENFEDFGFAFKEGNDETAWDDAHNITTFRYTEPMTWWMSMPKEMPRTLDAALDNARQLAAKADKNAQALLTSGYHDEPGRFVARLLNTPWCNGAVWSMNSSPGVKGTVTDFKNKWNPALRDQLYGPARKADLDGEYIDSVEGYVTDEYDFRREHFATAGTPLTFSPLTNRPALHRSLIAFEYVRAIAADLHGMKKLMMANGTPDRICWLVPLLDVMGTETDWNPNKQWRPMSDSELMYRRVLCGPKPYCFLMNTNFDNFPYELTEKFMKRCLAYGMFPGFFSADASTGHYFSRPDLDNRDRPLFKKYIPLCKLVAEAGWQPIPLARSSNEKVYVERFGRKYMTVFNDSPQRITTTVKLLGLTPRGQTDLVHNKALSWQANTTEITLDPEDVAVLEVQ